MTQYIDLSRRLTDLGYLVDRYTYECGERVTVRHATGTLAITRSADCGDEQSATDQIVAVMEKEGWPVARTHASE